MTKQIILDEYKENIKKLYFKDEFSLRQIAREIGFSATTIRKNMLGWNIQRRPSTKRDIIKPSKQDLEELYLNKKYCMEKIAEILNVNTTTVCKWINNYNIPVRKFKYEKFDFSGNPHEKAYLKGLAWGDFHVHKHCRQVAVEISTTHPAMIELFFQIFKNYGTPTKRVKYNKKFNRYQWRGDVYLNKSFDFLLNKDYNIDNEYFYYFLARFFDAEGTLHIYNNHGFIGLSLLIYNSNKKLLEIFKNRLEKDGFHPKLSLFSKKGTKNSDNYYQGVDLFAIRLHTNNEVLDLLNKMPIKHREKREKLKIASSINNSNKWSDIEEQINLLRMNIKNEVKDFTNPLNFQNERSPILQEIKK